MTTWIEAVEAKARIIHDQIAAVRALAVQAGERADELSRPYFELLQELYKDEFAFARLADNSDLVAAFAGPAVSEAEPTVSVVTSLFVELRDQIRSIAKSIAGLSTDKPLRWPSELDPHLSGISRGSLIVGICIPRPSERQRDQASLLDDSDQLFQSVRSAVRSLPIVAHYVEENRVSEAIKKAFPDPAVRDTVMVAASRLAPTGRRGIDGVTFYTQDSDTGKAAVLTPHSRKVLKQALDRPVRVAKQGTFDGVVREIDLDARRFEIRGLKEGAIRCVYDASKDKLAGKILDSLVRISGNYETLANEQHPRLIAVTSIEILKAPPTQQDIDDPA
jgi:hypothetical protein